MKASCSKTVDNCEPPAPSAPPAYSVLFPPHLTQDWLVKYQRPVAEALGLVSPILPNTEGESLPSIEEE